MKNILTNVDASPLDGACPNGKKNFVLPEWYKGLLDEIDQMFYVEELGEAELKANILYEKKNLERWLDGETQLLPVLLEHFSMFGDEILSQVRSERESILKPNSIDYWRKYVSRWTRWLCEHSEGEEWWKDELVGRFEKHLPEQLLGKSVAFVEEQFVKSLK